MFNGYTNRKKNEQLNLKETPKLAKRNVISVNKQTKRNINNNRILHSNTKHNNEIDNVILPFNYSYIRNVACKFDG